MNTITGKIMPNERVIAEAETFGQRVAVRVNLHHRRARGFGAATELYLGRLQRKAFLYLVDTKPRLKELQTAEGNFYYSLRVRFLDDSDYLQVGVQL